MLNVWLDQYWTMAEAGSQLLVDVWGAWSSGMVQVVQAGVACALMEPRRTESWLDRLDVGLQRPGRLHIVNCAASAYSRWAFNLAAAQAANESCPTGLRKA